MPELSLNEAFRALQLSANASKAEVKRAYNRLVVQVHPDKNRAPGAHDTFLRV